MTDATAPEDKPIEFRMGALLSDIRSRLPRTDTEAEQDEYIAEIKEIVEAAMTQARRDAFDILRDAFKDEQNADRWSFIQDCLCGAMEGHTFWFVRVNYDIGHEPDLYPLGVDTDQERRPASAKIIEGADDFLDDAAVEKALNEGHEDYPVFEVTHETIELGFKRIREATNVPDTGTGNWERNLTSIPFLGQGMRNLILRADLMHDAGMLDADAYSAILEIALLGEVRY